MCQIGESCAQADEGMCHCVSRGQSPTGQKDILLASLEGARVVPLPSGLAPARKRPSRDAKTVLDGKQADLGQDSGISTNASSRSSSLTSSSYFPESQDRSRSTSVDHTLRDTRTNFRVLKQMVQRRRSSKKAAFTTILDHCAEAGKNNWSLQFAVDGRSGHNQTLRQEELRKVTREMLRAKANSIETRELAARLEELKLQAADQLVHGRPTLPLRKQHLEAPRLNRPPVLPALLSPPQLKCTEVYAAGIFDTKKWSSMRSEHVKGSMTPRW